MKSKEFIIEGKSMPIICIDVQPEYSGMNDGEESDVFPQIINFVNNQTGPVLMFVNAEQDGLSGDTVQSIKQYWDDTVNGVDSNDENYGYDPETEEYVELESNINWNRFTIVDKGYGHFRAYMDLGLSEAAIIKLIRYLYQNKLNDARQVDQETMQQLMGNEYRDWMEDEVFAVNWTSIAQLKRFSGAYLVGGGRSECLREVELLMNAFNIRYRRIDSLVYG